jgi:hypothetical protein
LRIDTGRDDSGINRDAGGKNAPGARAVDNRPEVPKMCDGWYTDKITLMRVKQAMHRKATVLELEQDLKTNFINADNTIFEGMYEILKESGDTCTDEEGKGMIKECSQKRRRAMGCDPASACKKHVRFCLQNTLRWRPDFAAQKCRLEQTCDAVGVKYLMLMICHPECNPIEGW